MASMLAKMAKADFVKTSTGFGPSGANAHDVELMRMTVEAGPGNGREGVGRNPHARGCEEMAAAGATRIGASASIKIVEATTGAPQSAASGY